VFENVNITQALLIFVHANVNLTIVILTFSKYIYQSVYNRTYTLVAEHCLGVSTGNVELGSQEKGRFGTDEIRPVLGLVREFFDQEEDDMEDLGAGTVQGDDHMYMWCAHV
jgi:hypothetical protein